MSDLKVGETFRHRVLIIENATGNPWTLQNPTVVVIDESNNQAAPAAATEESNGYYHYDFTPDAVGTWTLRWNLAGSTIYHSPLIFKVGGGSTADILADTNELQTDLTDGGRIDLLIDAIKAKTDNLPADPADDSDIDAEIAVVDGFHDVPAQNSVNNSQIRDVVGNKTDTTAGNSVIAILKQILEDTGTTLDDLVDDLESRLTAARAGYLDKIANHEITKTFFSASQISVTITNGATDTSLPSVVLPNIAGTITHVYAGFMFRMVENTNAAANKLSGAQDIQVRVDTPGAWADAINLVDDQFGVAATTREGGSCVVGNIDLVGTVTAFNDTYEFQIDEAVADQSNLVFNDVQTFLIVSYY